MTDESSETTTKKLFPRGRSLSEFLPLSAIEARLLEAAAKGESAFVNPETPYARPEQSTEANKLRSDFLRFLALGGDATAPIHETGVRIYGAWIIGDLDFEFCDLPFPLGIDFCLVEGPLRLTRTRARTLRLNGTAVKAIIGDGFCCAEGFFMKRGFYAHEGVQLRNARIGGELNATGGRFHSSGAAALDCDGAEIEGSLHLGCEYWNNELFRFQAFGTVRLSGVKISGELACDGGQFFGSPSALVCDNTKIENAFLRCAMNEDGPIKLGPDEYLTFEAAGTVRFYSRSNTGRF